MRTRDKRIGRVQRAIDASPVCLKTLREDYKWFQYFGELPEDEHLAYEVVMQAMRGGKERQAHEVAPFREREQPRDEWPPSVRGFLFDEALSTDEQLRALARSAIATEVAWGGDVESPAFAARHGLPTYGCVALHVSGYLARLKAAPYEDQATRLFVRQDNVAGRINERPERWFQDFATAQVSFWTEGDLPNDDLLLDALLVFVEICMLAAHRRGVDVSQEMQLLDSITRAEDEELDELLAKLSAKAKAGKLMRKKRRNEDAHVEAQHRT